MKEPDSMEELIYFTRRKLDSGKAMAWVFREKCPNCKKGLMSKPVDPKTGDVKVRAKEYVCPECGHSVEKKEYEESLQANIKYTCPHCKQEGAVQIPFKRKKIKGTDALVFECEGCNKKIPITKKMKAVKEKSKN